MIYCYLLLEISVHKRNRSQIVQSFKTYFVALALPTVLNIVLSTSSFIRVSHVSDLLLHAYVGVSWIKHGK